MAKARVSELTANIAQLAGETGSGSQEQVTLRELENSAETLRNLYNSFLQKYKEIIQTETVPVGVSNARIITRASPPLQRNHKKALIVLAGSTMLGLLLGAGAAVARERTADVIRSPKAVEQISDKKCVILPAVEAKSALIEEFVLDSPYSRFTENLRNVKALIDSARNEGGPKVIGIVSAAPDEGKTVVAANLAALMIAASGARTLVVDSDLHLRKLTAALAPEAREGLVEALQDPSRLPALVSKRPRSGLDVLPCVSRDRIPNAAELLGSAKMEKLLAVAREHYDYIVIEIAPIMSVVDVKTIERFIDAFVFVVEWGQTTRGLIIDALSEAEIIRDRLLGFVLNKADPVEVKRIEAYRGSKSGYYYQE
jgi:succinoglycan biosynthesis transport protein ExoP